MASRAGPQVMPFPAIQIDRSGNVTVSWPMDAAEALAQLLYDEGVRLKDSGWKDDGQSIADAINEWKAARARPEEEA